MPKKVFDLVGGGDGIELNAEGGTGIIVMV